MTLCQALGGGTSFWRLAGAFAYSLVPIALAYQAAHYYTLLLTEGQNILYLVSDPFRWGWNLFGPSGYAPNASVVGAAFVWYPQVDLIVVGHVIAVHLARRRAANRPELEAGPAEPARDGRAHGPLHRHEPLDPLPTRHRVTFPNPPGYGNHTLMPRICSRRTL